ncbi:MAG: nucleotidyltransferase substrate binding protein [Geminicoccaceae bacterium]|nr:nucleotidyltransferase substrate binding protein [Geminicoccaceae bacterium]
MTDPTPRWQYRFSNFGRARLLLREALDLLDRREITQLEKEGLVQRFEYTRELAWKLLKDYLDHGGVVLPTVTPRAVIRAAHEAGVIDRADTWMRALEARNRMSHVYDARTFDRVIEDIRSCYAALFDELHGAMSERGANDD